MAVPEPQTEPQPIAIDPRLADIEQVVRRVYDKAVERMHTKVDATSVTLLGNPQHMASHLGNQDSLFEAAAEAKVYGEILGGVTRHHPVEGQGTALDALVPRPHPIDPVELLTYVFEEARRKAEWFTRSSSTTTNLTKRYEQIAWMEAYTALERIVGRRHDTPKPPSLAILDPIIVTSGAYTGWVGYVELLVATGPTIHVCLFPSDREHFAPIVHELELSSVRNLRQEQKL